MASSSYNINTGISANDLGTTTDKTNNSIDNTGTTANDNNTSAKLAAFHEARGTFESLYVDDNVKRDTPATKSSPKSTNTATISKVAKTGKDSAAKKTTSIGSLKKKRNTRSSNCDATTNADSINSVSGLLDTISSAVNSAINEDPLDPLSDPGHSNSSLNISDTPATDQAQAQGDKRSPVSKKKHRPFIDRIADDPPVFARYNAEWLTNGLPQYPDNKHHQNALDIAEATFLKVRAPSPAELTDAQKDADLVAMGIEVTKFAPPPPVQRKCKITTKNRSGGAGIETVRTTRSKAKAEAAGDENDISRKTTSKKRSRDTSDVKMPAKRNKYTNENSKSDDDELLSEDALVTRQPMAKKRSGSTSRDALSSKRTKYTTKVNSDDNTLVSDETLTDLEMKGESDAENTDDEHISTKRSKILETESETKTRRSGRSTHKTLMNDDMTDDTENDGDIAVQPSPDRSGIKLKLKITKRPTNDPDKTSATANTTSAPIGNQANASTNNAPVALSTTATAATSVPAPAPAAVSKTTRKRGKKSAQATIAKDFEGIASQHGYSTNQPPEAELDIPWQCGEPSCASGMTWLARNKSEKEGQAVGRKVISQYFGRNKTSTKSIPEDVWHWFCRKHYQRDKYARDNSSADRTAQSKYKATCLWTANNIEDQLTRLELWRPNATFTVALMSGGQKRLDAYHTELARNGNDHAAAVARMPVSNGKTPSPEKDFPIALLERFSRQDTGASKTYGDLRAIMAWIVIEINNGTTTTMCPLEFLIGAPIAGEVINDTTYNYQQWEASKTGNVFDISTAYTPGQDLDGDDATEADE